MVSVSEKKRKSREQAFIILFEKIFNADVSIDEIIKIAVEEEIVDNDKYMKSILKEADAHSEEIDEIVESNLKGWKMSRISKVSLALIRLAISEMVFLKSCPVGVSISEAVEICKKYGTDEDKSFVNGILGTVARSIK